MKYPIIANCNFESADDPQSAAIHRVRKAVEAGLTDDAVLIAALDDLEAVLTEHAESDSEISVQACAAAEADVYLAWTAEVRDAVEAERISRYGVERTICTCPEQCDYCRANIWVGHDHPECCPDPACPLHGAAAQARRPRY